MKRRLARVAIVAVALCLYGHSPAIAACSGPTGNAADIIYNNDFAVMQYCNGTSWVAMGPQLAPTSGKKDATITEPTPVAGNWFGYSVAISGNNMVIGGVAAGVGNGEAYIYDLSNPASPVEKAKITAPGSAGYFGHSVAVSGNTAVISADQLGTAEGEVYTYDITTPTAPVLKASFVASDTGNYDYFGTSLAISGNILAIGAPSAHDEGNGVVYIFDITNPASPVQDAEITASDGAQYDSFGQSVAISGNLLVVGASQHTVSSHANQGAAYVYDITTPTSPVFEAEISSSDGVAGDQFGGDVGISGTKAIIGAESKNSQGGAAYVFDMTNEASPVQEAEIIPSDNAAGDYFAGGVFQNIAISGNNAWITAAGVNGGIAGKAYNYDLSNESSPVLLQELTPSGTSDFGGWVALSGTTVLIGAYNSTVSGHTQAGEVFTYVPVSAASGCTSPTGNVGDDLYNSAYHVYQFCNGSNWVAMSTITAGAGGSGCTSPAGSEADKIYNSTSGVLQYCDGARWRQIGHHNN
jgi:hypothetical protein